VNASRFPPESMDLVDLVDLARDQYVWACHVLVEGEHSTRETSGRSDNPIVPLDQQEADVVDGRVATTHRQLAVR
jgi:hypothetical protein